MRSNLGLLAVLLPLASVAGADPTWPSAIDELEEIMFQVFSFRARKFADVVSPCSNEASGPGRNNAAEWLRTAFHDVSAHNVFSGLYGLDSSLQYELLRSENTGPGFRTTLEFMGNYYSREASMADLIALGVYFSVRSCGGPIIPVRGGRIDASEAGPGSQVPQVSDTVPISRNRFARMGFNQAEMIQMVACGHTLGGVHSPDFPEIVPPGTANNNLGSIDSTPAHYDNLVAVEFVAGNTTNPLVVGPSINVGKNSDGKVFGADGNATITALTDADVFRSTCQSILTKMIDTVPATVTLTDPITPYLVKPVALQLTLANYATSLAFQGYIRVHQTVLPVDASTEVKIIYKNRSGGSDCGSNLNCSFLTQVGGITQGFDDNFLWFKIDTNIPVATGISSFVIQITLAGGTTQTLDNNGQEYPINDSAMMQVPNSCLLQSSGALTVTAAVRNDRVGIPVKLGISYKISSAEGASNPVPQLASTEVDMVEGTCVGGYTLYTASYTIPGGLSYASKLDIISGDGSNMVIDGFNDAVDIGGFCQTFSVPPAASCTTFDTKPTTTSSSTTSSSTTSSSATSTPTEPVHQEIIGDYELSGCYTEANGRALRDKATADDAMTPEMCARDCEGYIYFGTEYGRECFCGNILQPSSTQVDISECNMICAGDELSFCGAGNRLELYTTTADVVIPTGAPSAVGGFQYVNCQEEGDGVRALSEKATASASMTHEICAGFCQGYKYMGVEYSEECFCGNSLDATSDPAASETECNMLCSGSSSQVCGGASRLGLFFSDDVAIHPPQVSASSQDWTFYGCITEISGGRTLSGKAAAADTMTLEVCAVVCEGYQFFGTEYGRECYCGDAIDEDSTTVDETECNMTCGGDSTEFCGASWRISVYEVAV